MTSLWLLCLCVSEHTGVVVTAAHPKQSIFIKKHSLACGPELLLSNNSSLNTETYKSCPRKGQVQLSLNSMGVFALALVGFFLHVLLKERETVVNKRKPKN